MTRKQLIIGNWKMNLPVASPASGRGEEGVSFIETINTSSTNCDIVICPPFIALQALARRGVVIGAQDCHTAQSGAHTGDISAEMLSGIGCKYVIVGHSERRADHNEGNNLVQKKAQAANRAGLRAIICIGESLQQREAGETLQVIENQLKNSIPNGADNHNTILAYEPVWAIGTGKVPSLAEITQVHEFINQHMSDNFSGYNNANEPANALYGGSVKPSNAKEILAISSVGGALVGGASLKTDDFNAICDATR